MPLGPKCIVLYSSLSSWGDETNPFAKQGHYVILNGEPSDPSNPMAAYDWRRDGKIIQIRSESEKATRIPENGMNDLAIQICLVGTPLIPPRGLGANRGYYMNPEGTKRPKSHYTEKQTQALIALLTDICGRYDIWPQMKVKVTGLINPRRRGVYAITQRGYHCPDQSCDAGLHVARIQEAVTRYRLDGTAPPLP